MKYFILLGLCFSTYAFSQFMSNEEIQKEYDVIKKGKQFTEVLSKDALERKKNLINEDDFMPKYRREELKKGFITEKLESKKLLDIKILDNVDLRYRDTIVKSQDNGKCTSYAGIGLIENLLQANGKIDKLDLSEWSAWWHYGQYSCEAFVNSITKNYVCDENIYPQYGKYSDKCKNTAWVKLKTTRYIDDSIEEMKASLSKNSVVYIGMKTPNSMLNCDKVINPKTTFASGGHALAVIGFLPTADKKDTLMILKNSWGSDCGDKGYQYYPASLCFKSGSYCVMWEFSALDIKEVPVPTPNPTPEPVCKKWKRIWYAPWKQKCVLWE